MLHALREFKVRAAPAASSARAASPLRGSESVRGSPARRLRLPAPLVGRPSAVPLPHSRPLNRPMQFFVPWTLLLRACVGGGGVHVCVCLCVCVCVCSWSSRSGCESRGASSTGHAARARAHAPAHRPLRSLAHAQRCLSGGGRGATHCAPETERACVLVSGKGLCGRGSCFDHDQSTSPCRLRRTMRISALLFREENLALLFREEKRREGTFRTLVRLCVRLRLVNRYSCSRWPPGSTASC